MNAQLDTSTCVAELEYCINDLGFVGVMVNPDPRAGHTAPGCPATAATSAALRFFPL
jgi:hypothetical protein